MGAEAAPSGPGLHRAGAGEEENDESAAVTVLFFAGAREAAGCAKAVLPEVGRTLGELVGHLRLAYGGQLEAVLPTCSVWLNRSPAPLGTVLRAGDEVAVLPPVSGG